MQLTKSQIQDELWKRGEISWKLHEGQEKIRKTVNASKSFLAQNMCARQFGKTVYNLWEATHDCLNNPGTVVKYGAAFYSDLEKYIFPTAYEFFGDCPQEIRPQIIESKKLIYFPHKRSTIDFFGCDRNPDGARGPKVKKVILDEAGYIDKLRYVYYDVVLPMFTHTIDLNPKCIMSGTPPESPDHPFTSFFMPINKKDGSFIRLTIDDNPLLTQEHKQRLIDEYFRGVETEAHRKVQWQKMRRELYCDILVDQERAIVPEFHHGIVQKFEKDKYFPYHFKYVGMDLGVKHKTVALYAVYDFLNARLHIIDECQMFGPTMTTKGLAEVLKSSEERAFGPKAKPKRVSDNNNLLLLQDLSTQYGLQFLPVVKRSHDKLIRRPLVAMVNKVRVWMGDGRILIDPKCKELIGCLENGIWDDKREWFNESPLYGHYDALAALVYMMQVIDDKTNPTPLIFEKDPYNTAWVQEENKFEKVMKFFK